MPASDAVVASSSSSFSIHLMHPDNRSWIIKAISVTLLSIDASMMYGVIILDRNLKQLLLTPLGGIGGPDQIAELIAKAKSKALYNRSGCAEIHETWKVHHGAES